MNRRSCLLGLLLALALPLHAQTVMLDRVAVIVDDDVIMESEVRERIAIAIDNLRSREAPLPPPEVLRQDILNLMVLENLQLQMAERAGVRISDAQLNETLSEIAARNGLDLEGFRQAITDQGLSYAGLREQVRMQMLTQRVQRGNVSSRVRVGDDEISAFLASEEGRALTAPDLRLEHILIELPPTADAAAVAAAEAVAAQWLARARAGTPFASLAGSAGVTARHTDLGWRKPDQLPSLLAEVAMGLAVGESAGPLRNDSGLHLVHLAERRGSDRHLVQQTRARHILIKPSEIRSEAQARALADSLRQRLLAGADFADLARQHSEDIGSAMEGGQLGWTGPGQFVPVFERTMNALPPNTVSEPVRSEFGWHLIEVLERREQDVGEEIQRNIAFQYLFERKYEDELQAWLTRIRDEAYVDIK